MLRIALCVAIAALAATSAAASVRHAACPSATHAAALPRWRSGGSLRGATIHYAPNAPAYCGFFLVVGRYAYPIEHDVENSSVLGRDWAAEEPTIEAVLDLGTGHDVFAVASWQGASNLFVGLYTVDSGRLVRLPVGGQRELSLYGSLGVGSLYVTCDRRGGLTAYENYPTPNGKKSVIATTVYRLSRDRFRRVSAQSTSKPSRALLNRLTVVEKAGQFAGCIVARGPKFR